MGLEQARRHAKDPVIQSWRQEAMADWQKNGDLSAACARYSHLLPAVFIVRVKADFSSGFGVVGWHVFAEYFRQKADHACSVSFHFFTELCLLLKGGVNIYEALNAMRRDDVAADREIGEAGWGLALERLT